MHPCYLCGKGVMIGNGTGRTEGVARALFERHPITRVVLTDRKPVEAFFLYHWLESYTRSDDHYLPKEIFDWLPSISNDTEAAALDALSDACVAYGRALVGLPALEAKR